MTMKNATRPDVHRRCDAHPVARRGRARRGRSARGAVCIWAVLMMMVLVGFVGLSLDVAYGTLVAGKLQNAADAACLAGVAKVSASVEDARLAAYTLAAANEAGGGPVQISLNEGNSADGDIVIGTYDRATGVFTATLTSPNAVKVVARRTETALGGSLPLLFGPIFGVGTVELERTAIAMIESSGGDAGVICLNEDDPQALFLTGNAVLEVNATEPGVTGAVQVNSDNSQGVKTTGNSEIQADELNVAASSLQWTPDVTGDVNTSQAVMPDPMGSMAEPTSWGTNYGSVSVSGSSSVTLQPGYYPGGIKISANATVDLEPGLYVIGGGNGLKISGNGNMYGDDVMFYIAAGSVSLTGNGDIDLTAPDSGEYAGIVMWQARDNTNTVKVAGNGDFGTDGILYLPSAYVQVSGNGKELGSQLICDKLKVNGNGTFTVNYDGGGGGGSSATFLVR